MRMPKDLEEGRALYDQWYRLNGRYYIKADVRLGDGCVYRDVVFDGDSYIAVEVNRRPIYEQPAFIGQPVLAFLVTRDRSPGRHSHVATPEDRALFEGSG
jgi:hypothetical protein